MENFVLKSTGKVIKNPKYVTIDDSVLETLAQEYSKEELKIPSWDAPVFPKENNDSTVDFFLLGNSINFAFTDFETGEKYCSEYMDIPWKGAFGMWAALKKAVETGTPILDGNYLKDISEGDMKDIFQGKTEIPMFQERLNIFREVGKVLSEKYDGHFHNLVKASNEKLFDDSKGLVERLIIGFPSFDDSNFYGTDGQIIDFDKRAQLAAGMIYGRFRDEEGFQFEDVDKLTVFADYQVPRVLRHLGVLVYNQSLADKVDNEQLIPAGSQEELEIRASTIHSADRLIQKINTYRDEDKVNALHVDYKLWSAGRKLKDMKPHHLTITTAY